MLIESPPYEHLASSGKAMPLGGRGIYAASNGNAAIRGQRNMARVDKRLPLEANEQGAKRNGRKQAYRANSLRYGHATRGLSGS